MFFVGVAAALIIILVVVLLICFYKRRRRTSKFSTGVHEVNTVEMQNETNSEVFVFRSDGLKLSRPGGKTGRL